MTALTTVPYSLSVARAAAVAVIQVGVTDEGNRANNSEPGLRRQHSRKSHGGRLEVSKYRRQRHGRGKSVSFFFVRGELLIILCGDKLLYHSLALNGNVDRHLEKMVW